MPQPKTEVHITRRGSSCCDVEDFTGCFDEYAEKLLRDQPDVEEVALVNVKTGDVIQCESRTR